MLAALGALTTDWDEIAKGLSEEISKHVPKEDAVAKRGRIAKERTQRVLKETVSPSYPHLPVALLRMGIGYQQVEGLRQKDLAAYIDHGAADRYREAAKEHPIQWYKELLDTTFIPNASIAALAEIAATAISAVGYITGLNRRFASLLGVAVGANNLLADYKDPDKRSTNVVSLLAQLLLVRTGG
jgi:hypothetical protein